MPPFTPAMARRHKKGLSAKQVRQWCAVATSTYEACLGDGGAADACEARAIRAANGVTGAPAAQEAHPYQEIVTHVAATATRREWFDGREYLVARVVPIVEAVLNEYFVPAEEIAACLESWNDLPLPIGHPRNAYGDPISGREPALLEHSVGRFFNAQMDGARLVGEVWLDIEKCTRLGGEAAEVLRRVAANEIVEVSTAFYPQTTLQSGVFNGTPYRGIHRNLRPAHLALLPNGIGACHAGMGCGIRAAHATAGCACGTPCTCNNGDALMDLEADEKQPGKLRQALQTLLAFANGAAPEETADRAPSAPTAAEGAEAGPAGPAGSALTIHLTQDDLRLALYAALARGRATMFGPDIIRDITTDGHVVYQDGERLFRRAYTIGDDNAVTLSEDTEEVQRDTRYVPVTAAEAVMTNQQQPADAAAPKGGAMLTKAQLVEKLIAHEQTTWTPADAEVLQAFEERALEKLIAEADERGQTVPLTPKRFEEMLTQALTAHTQAFDQKLATFAQQAEERAEREHIVGYLVTHQGWKQDEAQGLPLTALRQIHRMADPVSYVGQGMPRFAQGSMDEDLPANEVDWSK